MKVSSRVTGLGTLKAALDRIADEQTLRQEIETAAHDLREAAQRKLSDGQPPESRTGALARSLHVAFASDSPEASVSTPLAYGWHLEFGTLTRPARPWLAPALDEIRPRILQQIREWLARGR
ncbi:MAG: hypothetical protein ACFCUR_03345 [Rhodomicrobiaceae bacterium]